VTLRGTVSQLSIAPVKGLSLLHPESVEVTADGVVGDRRYAMIDERGNLASGKRFGPLVRVVPTSAVEPASLVLALPDGRAVGGAVEVGEPVHTVFYGEARAAHLVLGDYAEALSELAGEPLRLVRMDEPDGGIDRPGDGVLSLLSTSALDEMASSAGLDARVDGRRFRMNVLVDGLPPHAEDGWVGRRVRVGGAVVVPRGNIGRCAITTQDPDTGLKSLDTLKLIAATRGDLPTTEPLPFGVHAEVVVPGRVAHGDVVELDD
jgi:hypothetical protein